MQDTPGSGVSAGRLVRSFIGGADRRVEAVCTVGHHETMTIDLSGLPLAWHESKRTT
jgi:hypothetical protein